MFGRIFSLVRKELIQVFRNTVTMRLILVAPIIQLTIFGYVAVIDVTDVPTAVLDHDKSAESRRLIQDFEKSGYFTVKKYLSSEQEIDGLMNNADVDLVLVIPATFSKDISNGNPTEITGIMDGTDSNTAITVGNYFNGVALRYASNMTTRALGLDGEDITAALVAKQRVFFNPEMESINYIVPGIIAVLLMNLMVMLSAISIVRERERGTYDQLIVSPIRVGEMLIGKTIPFAILGYMTTFLVLIVGIFWFQVPFRGSFVLLIVTTGLFILSALGQGIFVSSLARTQQQALMLSMFVLIPQLLLSGFVFPIESMPDFLQKFTYLIPTRYYLVIIRAIFLKGVGSEYLLKEIAALITFSVVIFSLAAIKFSRRQQI